MIETKRLLLRPFEERYANDDPIYENTLQYAILKQEWDART